MQMHVVRLQCHAVQESNLRGPLTLDLHLSRRCSSHGGSLHSNTLGNCRHLVTMASQSRTLPVLVAAACCVAVLRSFWAPSQQTFVAPQQSVHMGCQALSGGALASGNVPAIVNTVPARPGVPAHFKVTLETPDGTQSFATWQHSAAVL